MSSTPTKSAEIPLVDLRAQYATLRDEILGAIASALDGMHLYLGPQQQTFEKEFAYFCQCLEAIGVSNGTDALELALRALGIGEGDEVITQPNSFIATAEAISAVGATPVFVDVFPEKPTLNPAFLEARITPRTKAIIPVHLYGYPADMDSITAIARSYSLAVIEDASQAHGAMLGERRIGSLGDLACFSFYYSKNLGAYGEAGAVTTSNPVLAERLRMYRNHGSRERYSHEIIGRNARLDEIQAAILCIKLKHLEGWNELRRAHALRLLDALKETSLELPAFGGEGTYEVFHLFVVRHSRRDQLRAFLEERGIATGIHYPLPIHLQPAYAHLGYAPGDFPVAERWASQCLSLPLYPELSEDQIEQIVTAVQAFERTAAR